MTEGRLAGRVTRFAPSRTAERSQTAGATMQPVAGNPETTRENGQAAAALLNSVAFQGVFESLRDEALIDFANSTPGLEGQGERNEIHARIWALAEISRRLHTMQEDARILDEAENDEDRNREFHEGLEA